MKVITWKYIKCVIFTHKIPPKRYFIVRRCGIIFFNRAFTSISSIPTQRTLCWRIWEQKETKKVLKTTENKSSLFLNCHVDAEDISRFYRVGLCIDYGNDTAPEYIPKSGGTATIGTISLEWGCPGIYDCQELNNHNVNKIINCIYTHALERVSMVSMFFLFSLREILENIVLVDMNKNLKKNILRLFLLESFFSGLKLEFLSLTSLFSGVLTSIAASL